MMQNTILSKINEYLIWQVLDIDFFFPGERQKYDEGKSRDASKDQIKGTSDPKFQTSVFSEPPGFFFFLYILGEIHY